MWPTSVAGPLSCPCALRSTALPRRVSVPVESHEFDAVSGKPPELRLDLVLRAPQVIETVNDKSPGEPLADLPDGMGEPGPLAPIPIGRPVLPDHARKRPPALAAGSFDRRCLPLELSSVVRARVPDHGRRVLLLGRRWRRGRRRAVACPSMGVGGRRCGPRRRIGCRNPPGTPWTKSPQHQQRQGRHAECSKQEDAQKADATALLACVVPGARAGWRRCARRPGGT
jgi:hypothetical protein